ncbi:hypothetical protein KCU91_g14203, partial [Aureobasidium melanogenum]
MPINWKKIKAFLCCGEEEDTPLLISGPTDFKRINVELTGLTEHERELINNRPVPVTYPLNTKESDGDARLERAVAHTRRLSNTIKSVTTTAMSTVGAKSSGYSALANETSFMMQRLNFEAANSTEIRQLLSHSADGVKASSSMETAMAGCEEDDDDARSFAMNK